MYWSNVATTMGTLPVCSRVHPVKLVKSHSHVLSGECIAHASVTHGPHTHYMPQCPVSRSWGNHPVVLHARDIHPRNGKNPMQHVVTTPCTLIAKAVHQQTRSPVAC